tara:strand:+ start:316 stop:468 length:153 start_codon:yes stop_codon:yes gene_type:complete
MNYLKEMNELDIGFEVIYYDENLVYYTNTYDTEEEALEFISTLSMTGIIE